MRNKISKAMSNQTAVVLYQKDFQRLEKHHANIKDLLFFTDAKVGCSMLPKVGNNIFLLLIKVSLKVLYVYICNTLDLAFY